MSTIWQPRGSVIVPLFLIVFSFLHFPFLSFCGSKPSIWCFYSNFLKKKEKEKPHQSLFFQSLLFLIKFSHIFFEIQTSRHKHRHTRTHNTLLVFLGFSKDSFSHHLLTSLSAVATACFHQRMLPILFLFFSFLFPVWLPLPFSVINFLRITLGCTADAAEVKELMCTNMHTNRTCCRVGEAELLPLSVSENERSLRSNQRRRDLSLPFVAFSFRSFLPCYYSKLCSKMVVFLKPVGFSLHFLLSFFLPQIKSPCETVINEDPCLISSLWGGKNCAKAGFSKLLNILFYTNYPI